MMRPCRRSIIGLAKAREQRNAPVRFTSMIRRHSSSGMSARSFGDVMPALLNRMSARPKLRDHRVARRLTAASSVTSASTTSARRPACSTACGGLLAAWRRCGRQARGRRRLRPSATAAAVPIPPPAPVTTATSPSRLKQCARGSSHHIAIWPPSTGSATPVIMRASSETRKSAALATSSGSGMRPSGIVARNRFIASSRSAAMPGRKASSIGVADHGRTERIDADILRREFKREAAHQADDAVLGNRIEAEIRLCLEALQRRRERAARNRRDFAWRSRANAAAPRASSASRRTDSCAARARWSHRRRPRTRR